MLHLLYSVYINCIVLNKPYSTCEVPVLVPVLSDVPGLGTARIVLSSSTTSTIPSCNICNRDIITLRIKQGRPSSLVFKFVCLFNGSKQEYIFYPINEFFSPAPEICC